MSITISPVKTITPGGQVTVSQPSSGQTVGLVVIDNLSTYILQVSVGADTWYQAPLVEAAYDMALSNGQPVVVSAIEEPGDNTTSGQLTFTWYGPTDTPLSATWPIALSGPAEVAAATAAAIFELGVPNVFVSGAYTGPVTFTGGAPPYQTAQIDVHEFATLDIVVIPNAIPSSVWYYFINFGSAVQASLDQIASTTGQSQIAEVPVTGGQIVFYSYDATPPAVYYQGTNRALAEQHPINQGFSSSGMQWTTGNTAFAVNGVYQLGASPGVAVGAPFQGPAYGQFAVVGSTAVKGQIFVQTYTGPDGPFGGQNINMVLADTTEMHTISTTQQVMKQFALPANVYSVFFQCFTAGTGNVTMTAAPAY